MSRNKKPDTFNFRTWCKVAGLLVKPEFRFEPSRRWRADFAVPALRVLIEIEGVSKRTSRHTTIAGYRGDCRKYNAANCRGWNVLRYTQDMWARDEWVADLEAIAEQRRSEEVLSDEVSADEQGRPRLRSTTADAPGA